jgi:aldehyde:ferredoxin oxidoreductase
MHQEFGVRPYQTTDLLWEKHGRNYSVLAMGTAGERLVNLSVCLVDKTTTWGKGGLPAVMSSKNVKAFIACGNKSVGVADPNRLMQRTRVILDRFKRSPTTRGWWSWGPWMDLGMGGCPRDVDEQLDGTISNGGSLSGLQP